MIAGQPMQYAVLQLDLAPPGVEALQRAFARTRTLCPSDAVRVARESFGVIAQHLEVFEARDLAAALNKVGVAAQAVAENDLLQLPPSLLVHRLDCLQAGVTLYDALWRQTFVAWSEVLMVAAGAVTLTDFVAQTPQYYPGNIPIMGPPIGLGTVSGSVRRNSQYAEKPTQHLLLEVVLRGMERYRADGGRLTYDYLGERRRPNAVPNFTLLVRDLLLLAPSAITNLGACALRDGSEFVYPNRKVFENEMVWRLWNQTRQR
jgi:hypothetical protein